MRTGSTLWAATLQKTGRTFQVLDGQQRLTTAIVLLDFLEAHVGEQSCSLGKLFVNANVCYQDVLGQEEEAEEVQSKRSAAEKRTRRSLNILPSVMPLRDIRISAHFLTN